MKIIGLTGPNQAQRLAAATHLAEAHGFEQEWMALATRLTPTSLVIADVSDPSIANAIRDAGGQIWHFGGSEPEVPPNERDQVLIFDGEERLFFPLIDKALECAPEVGWT